MSFKVLTFGSGLFFSALVTAFAFSGLWVWTVITVGDSFPGWVANSVILNSISIRENSRASLQNTYLISQEAEIRNLKLAISEADIRRALARLQKVIRGAVGGR